MNDMAFAIELESRTCNGQPCKITDSEFSWSESGGRYEFVLNRPVGEGYATVLAEKTAIFKNCRNSERKPSV
jgi:hypothetical protein